MKPLFRFLLGALALSFLGLAASPNAHAQAPAWQLALPLGVATSSNSSGYDPYLATDASGKVYLAGTFTGTMTIGSTVLTAASPTVNNLYVACWNPQQAAFAWVVQGGGAAGAVASGIAVSGNSVYVAGKANAGATFGGQPPVGSGTVLVAKLSTSNGAFGWAALTGASTNTGSPPTAVALAANANGVYVAGRFVYNITFGSTTLTRTGDQDAYVAKLTDAGSSASVAWVVGTTGTNANDSDVYPHALTAGSNGVYLAGSFSGPVGFGATTLTNNGYPSSTQESAFVAKLADTGSTGVFGWTQQPANVNGSAYAVAVSGSSVYVGGYFYPTSTSYPTGYITKLTDGGSTFGPGWTRTLTATATATQPNAAAAVLRLLAGPGGLYALGRFGGALSLDATTLTATPSTAYNLVAARLTDAGSTGSFDWALRAGGSSQEEPSGLALSGSTLYVGNTSRLSTGPLVYGSQSIPAPSSGAMRVLAAISNAAPLATAAPAALAPPRALWPNPAHDQATVPVAAGTAAVRVLDALGREVRRCPVAAGATEATLDLRGLPAGLYLVRTGAAGSGQKLVVE